MLVIKAEIKKGCQKEYMCTRYPCRTLTIASRRINPCINSKNIRHSSGVPHVAVKLKMLVCTHNINHCKTNNSRINGLILLNGPPSGASNNYTFFFAFTFTFKRKWISSALRNTNTASILEPKRSCARKGLGKVTNSDQTKDRTKEPKTDQNKSSCN